jgi:hypothetical protein
MLIGIKLIVGGIAALVCGCLLYSLPKEFDMKWYQPLPAFPLGVLLIAMGVYCISRDSNAPVGPAEDNPDQRASDDPGGNAR